LPARWSIARSEYKPVAEVETDYGQLPPVTCHTSQINQVVLNLVVNARMRSPTRSSAAARSERSPVSTRVEGERVVIAIGDTGGGIPEDIRARIFDPFFTTKEVGRGTGQGLSIARNVIVKGHGGELDFTTELGKGTTFYIRLPISRD
jgi:signal transduction histidine kinase